MKSSLIPALALLVMLIISSCKEEKKSVTTDDVITVKTAPVTLITYSPQLEYSGMIASLSEAKLSFKIGGLVAHTYVKEGDHVTAGQLLATLDMTEINAQVQQSIEGSDKAQRDMKRVQSLFNDTAATLEQLQNAQTQLSVSNENMRIAKFNQQYAQIHATQSGTIIRKMMNEGEMAAPGMEVFMMNGTSGDDWVVRLGVSDKDWVLLKRGDNAGVMIDAYPEKKFTGIITQVAGAADPNSGTYEIEMKVLPGDVKFAAGLFATIHLQPSQKEQVHVIPIEALCEADGKTGYVYGLNDDKQAIKKIPVTIAFIENDRVGISSGLENVKEVITSGVGYLTPASRVKLADNSGKK